MTEITERPPPAVATTLRVLVPLEALTFLLGALLHLGVRIPLGFAVLAEPQIIDATIVEGLCGLFLAVSAFAVFTRRSWAWPVAIAAHAFAVAGVLLGIGALAAGLGSTTELNYVYHRVVLVVLVSCLALLLTPIGRAALGLGDRVSRRG